VVRIPDTAHVLIVQEPERTADAIVSFIQEGAR
jgi:hypothetical protein